ncbi:glycosyltransferase [uncultured Microbacterium sp.]|uniref:glycosyltransferase n=1 Tax=uncultured Microbacterium sp. TaxID=191216 RepID=UPI002599AD55|nr:glycosyltransferase [uncultured Microbacterium sp.]
MTAPIVVASLEPWDDVWRRNQYVIDGLLRAEPQRQVLFIEPPTDPVHDVSSGRPPRMGRGLRVAEGYEGRLQLLEPTKWLPRVLGDASDAMLARVVGAAVRRLGWERPVLWINDPLWAHLLASIDGPTLYDMTDDWVEADRAGRVNQRLRAADTFLLDHADAVVVCSDGLAASRGGLREVQVIHNAVDVARYRDPAPRPADLPPGAVALYAGTLHEDRLDVALLVTTGKRLAERGGAVVLVGPNALSAHNTAALVAEGRCLVLGARPFREIPGYLQHADVLIVPHVADAFTESLDPIKLYEYRAVGRPIVSTPVAGFRDAQGVDVVRGGEFAERVVELALLAPPTGFWGEVPDWSHRVDEFDAVLRTISN